jgi:hypothetical protein
MAMGAKPPVLPVSSTVEEHRRTKSELSSGLFELIESNDKRPFEKANRPRQRLARW